MSMSFSEVFSHLFDLKEPFKVEPIKEAWATLGHEMAQVVGTTQIIGKFSVASFGRRAFYSKASHLTLSKPELATFTSEKQKDNQNWHDPKKKKEMTLLICSFKLGKLGFLHVDFELNGKAFLNFHSLFFSMFSLYCFSSETPVDLLENNHRNQTNQSNLLTTRKERLRQKRSPLCPAPHLVFCKGLPAR